MVKNIFKSIAWMALYFGASLIGSIVSLFIYLFHSIVDIPSNLEDNTVLMEFITELIMKSAMLGIIIAALICIIAYVIYKLTKKDNFNVKSIDYKKVFFCIGLGLFLNAVISFILSLLTPILPEQLNSSLNDVLNIALTGHPIIILLGAGILAPIMEEIIFRHGIYRTLSRSNVIVGYIVSSLIFGIAHGNLIQGTYAVILGLIFAFILRNTNNLIYPIIIHITINSSSAIATFLPEHIPELLYLAVMFVVSLIFLLPFIKSKSVIQLLKK